MFAKSAIAFAVLATVVVAQTMNNNTIIPASVSLTLRAQWCQGQTNTCGTLCGGALNNNTCDENTLQFSCLCASNNSAPGLQYYTETMDTFICEEIFDNCITAGENDQAAQALCKTNEQKNCGHLDPANFTAAAVTSSSASAPPTSTSPAPSGTAASTSTSSNAAAATMAGGQSFGTGALAVGVAAAFGFIL